MDEQAATLDSTFRSNIRQARLPSCIVDVKILTKVYNSLAEFCKEGASNEISRLKQGSTADDQFAQLKSGINEAYKVNIEILGANGEYFSSTSSELLGADRLPNIVTRITFDTSFIYRSIFKSIPYNSIRLVFDFSKPPLLDFVSNPSQSTKNDSSVEILGQSESWVNGVYQTIVGTLKERATRRRWLHITSAYDVLLWFLVVPLSLWNLHKSTIQYSAFFATLSTVLSAFLFIYFFLIILFGTRFFFNYARWVFPYLELETSRKTKSAKHRILFFVLLAPIVSSLLKEVILYLVKVLF